MAKKKSRKKYRHGLSGYKGKKIPGFMSGGSPSHGGRVGSLRAAYKRAKAERSAAGKAWRKSHTSAHLKRYQHAERTWQRVGAQLGAMSGTHKRRKPQTTIFSRKRKSTRTRRRR